MGVFEKHWLVVIEGVLPDRIKLSESSFHVLSKIGSDDFFIDYGGLMISWS